MVYEDEVIGEGSFSVVYKGVDRNTSTDVAVKIFKCSQDRSTVSSFRPNIEVMKMLCDDPGGLTKETVRRSSSGSFDIEALREELQTAAAGRGAGGAAALDPATEHINLKMCIVQMLDYSRGSDGEPGKDEHGVLYLAMELGRETLGDWFKQLSKDGKTLSADQLRELQWTLVSIVAGLHTKGFVHLDIKPINIVRFGLGGGFQWKLIDFDGAARSGERIDLDNVTLTPKYMPPEIASTFGDTGKERDLRLSRRMDVWSVGMCAVEAVFLQPILGPWFEQWRQETGSDDKFYLWLADFDTDPVLSGDIVDHLSEIDPDMCDLLQGMLTKDPEKRLCIASCWRHRWFQPIRDAVMSRLVARPRDLVTRDQSKDAAGHPLISRARRSARCLSGRSSGATSAVCASM